MHVCAKTQAYCGVCSTWGRCTQGGQTTGGAEGPNKILFVQDMPEAATIQMVQMLFSQFPGFSEVRMVEARPGIAFVEYEADSQATAAMKGLQEFKITPQNAIRITYARQ